MIFQRYCYFRGIPPVSLLALALAVGLAVMTTVVMLALQQPWLGLELEAGRGGVGLRVAASKGPSAEIPVGTQLLKMANETHAVTLEPFDLTIEPDGVIPDYPSYRRLMARQEQLSTLQQSNDLRFIAGDGKVYRVNADPRGRPLTELPPDFWVGLAVGLIAWLVSAGVFACRPKDAAARYLLLSGFATLLFAPAAAIYTTRELAVDGTIFRWASDINFFGGSLFTASFVGLLLHYPRRLAPAWVGLAVVGLFVVWFGLQQLNVFESMTFARRFLVMVGVFATFVLAAVHWFRTRRDPVARAALQWFLLSWLVGTGVFALFILLPQTFGVNTTPVQGYAFLLFLLVYGGLAFGILRYRLFDLGDWWRRVAAWTISGILFVCVDLLFLLGLNLSSRTSLALALLICGAIWLPIRGWLWRRIAAKREYQRGDVFGRVMRVALSARGSTDQIERWKDLLRAIYDPLRVVAPELDVTLAKIHRDGLALAVPAVGPIPSLQLEFARGGRGLFTVGDARLATELVTMLGHGMESRSAFENGVAEERSRIARDMHDNIGAQLLAALHSHDATSKDLKIRETLADLRDVINNAETDQLSIDEACAELRIEAADRLAAVGIELHWKNTAHRTQVLDSKVCHGLRSIVRESISNVIRHSGADAVEIMVADHARGVTLEIADNGKGFHFDSVIHGNGLLNIHERVTKLGGTIDLASTSAGTRLAVIVPIQPPTQASS